MPRYLECTYVRKDLVGATLDLGNFPIPEDIKCRPDVPELELDFWKPCLDPVTFVAPDASQVDILRRIITKEDIIVSKKEDAKGDLVFILEKNDIVPLSIVFSLDNFRQKGNMAFTIIKNNTIASQEIRFFNKSQSVTYLCNEPIFNFR